MSEKPRGLLFRKRNALIAALAAGIGLGVYLGNMGFDFGFGKKGDGGGKEGTSQATSRGSTGGTKTPTDSSENTDEIIGDVPAKIPDLVRVVIDDRQYLLRGEGKETPIALTQLIDLIRKAPGDPYGVRVRIYQKMSARASAEEELRKELLEAEIPDTAIVWVPPDQKK